MISSHYDVKHLNLTLQHHNGPLISNCNNPQYKIAKINGITLKAGTLANNCCGLHCGAIICIENIAYCTKRNIPVIIGYEFLEKEDVFKIPCSSRLLGIYLVYSRSELKVWPLKDINKKYVKLPCGNDKYAVFPLLHSQI